MTDKPMLIRAYTGQEAGLMIIGTPDSLVTLGKQLQKAALITTAQDVNHWPKQVAVIESDGPYLDRPDFRVSFHLGNGNLPESLSKLSRYGTRTSTVLVVGSLSMIGLITIIRSLASAL